MSWGCSTLVTRDIYHCHDDQEIQRAKEYIQANVAVMKQRSLVVRLCVSYLDDEVIGILGSSNALWLLVVNK